MQLKLEDVDYIRSAGSHDELTARGGREGRQRREVETVGSTVAPSGVTSACASQVFKAFYPVAHCTVG